MSRTGAAQGRGGVGESALSMRKSRSYATARHGIVGHAAAEQSRPNGLPATRADIVAACEHQALSLYAYPAGKHIRDQSGNHPRPAAGRHAKHIVHQTAGAQRL